MPLSFLIHITNKIYKNLILKDLKFCHPHSSLSIIFVQTSFEPFLDSFFFAASKFDDVSSKFRRPRETNNATGSQILFTVVRVRASLLVAIVKRERDENPPQKRYDCLTFRQLPHVSRRDVLDSVCHCAARVMPVRRGFILIPCVRAVHENRSHRQATPPENRESAIVWHDHFATNK